MAVEVPCPNCRSLLRAPDDAAGKRVRCKKCNHRFHVPGGVHVADGVGESQMLSVVDTPAAPPPAPTPGNAFEFDSGPAPVYEDDPPRRSGRRGSKGSNLLLILAVVGGVLLLGLVGVGVVAFLVVRDAANTIVSNMTVATAPGETKPPDETEPKPDSKPTDAGKTAPSPKAIRAPVKGKRPEGSPPSVTGPPAALPAPPTGATTLVGKPKTKLALESPASEVRGVRFSEGAAPTAAVLWKSFAGFQGAGAKDTLDLYSTSTSRRYDRIEFPADGFTGSRPFDVSKDGQRVAIEQPPGKLTVYDTESKEKVIDGVDLFDGGRTGPPSAMRFLTPDKLLVFDRAGALCLWDVPQKKAVVTGEPFGPIGAMDPMAVVSEISGDRVFVGVPGGVVAVGVGNGQKIGATMPLPNPQWVPLGIAADPNARQVAVVFRAPNATPAHGLYLFPPGGGRGVTVQVPLPDAGGTPVGVSFPSDQVITIHTDGHAGGFIYDLENRVLTAYVRSPSGQVVQFADSISGRYWLLAADPMDDKKSSFTAVELPFDGYFDLVNEAKGDRKPVFLVPRADGLAKGK